MSGRPTLPLPCQQIVILAVGARFRAGYEIYAHAAVARDTGLDDGVVAAVIAGQRPPGLQPEQAAAYDIATLVSGGSVLPALNYEVAERMFGPDGIADLIYLIGLYCIVSVTLNGFAVPVPELPDGE